MELALVILSIVVGIIAGVFLVFNAIDMIKEKEEQTRIEALGVFLFCALIVVYTIMVMIYLPLPLS